MIPETGAAKRLWGNLVSCIRDHFPEICTKNAPTLFGQWFHVLSQMQPETRAGVSLMSRSHGRDRIELGEKDLAEHKENEGRESRLVRARYLSFP